MILYHGTTSTRADAIMRYGFHLPAYLAPDLDEALHYAACGGEWDLQAREEAYHAAHGEWPRELFDFWEMARRLYSEGDTPVVVVLDVPDDLAKACAPDSGARDAVIVARALDASCFVEVLELAWHEDDEDPPAVVGSDVR